MRRIPVLLALLALATPAGAAVAEGERRGTRLRLATTAAAAEVDLAHYRLHVLDRHGLLSAERRHGGVFYERAGAMHRLGRVRAMAPREDGVVLTVDTDEGASASVTLLWLTPRTLEVTVEPPEPATLSAVGDRWRSPRSEVIYGLTERLRDSPPIADGLIDIPMEDVKPVPVGSLDRRGETVAMYVRPTFSLYAPFYQSSRGYGLAVAGTAIGLFDVAASDPRTLAFRFETGTTPESRRLRFHVFVGPEHATILDEYTRLTGRPFVPPAWAMIVIYRKYTTLRVTLQDYIVAAAREAGASGLPIARPLVFLDRKDRRLRDLWDQYLFGPDLMVAPVWKVGERRRPVYFPRGRWRSYWDPTRRWRGPRTAMVDAPLDTIPVFVRGDAQVPAPGGVSR